MKPHATVNYVFAHPFEHLVQYHRIVMDEMARRGYHVNALWLDSGYRGQRTPSTTIDEAKFSKKMPVYPEHDEAYLQECLDNLREKGIILVL